MDVINIPDAKACPPSCIELHTQVLVLGGGLPGVVAAIQAGPRSYFQITDFGLGADSPLLQTETLQKETKVNSIIQIMDSPSLPELKYL